MRSNSKFHPGDLIISSWKQMYNIHDARGYYLYDRGIYVDIAIVLEIDTYLPWMGRAWDNWFKVFNPRFGVCYIDGRNFICLPTPGKDPGT